MMDFKLLIISVNKFFGISHTSELVNLVLCSLLLMLLLIIVFFLLTLMTLIFHKMQNSWRKRYHRFYTQWLIQFLIDSTIPIPEAPIFSRSYLRDAILDMLFVTKGYEFTLLKEIYIKNGFWDKDLESLHATFWYQKLEALVRLDQWKISLGMDNLKHLFWDEDKHLKQMALKNLSRTKNSADAEYLLDTMNSSLDRSCVHEIIFRLTQNHRYKVLNCLVDKKKMYLWPSIIKVLGDIRLIEAIPVLISFAMYCPDESIRSEALIAMGKIGDPRSVIPLKRALSSQYSTERLSALHSLVMIDPSEVQSSKDELLNDKEPLIRNWMGHYLRVGL